MKRSGAPVATDKPVRAQNARAPAARQRQRRDAGSCGEDVSWRFLQGDRGAAMAVLQSVQATSFPRMRRRGAWPVWGPAPAQNARLQRARVALGPAAGVDRLEELIEARVEGGWLLKIERVARIRHHHERRAH